jgi:hypothetical protein
MTENVEKIKVTAAELLRAPVRKITVIEKGGNNHLYKIETDSSNYALKMYRYEAEDLRDRYKTETTATQFLQENDIIKVPKFIIGDTESRIAIFEWISGSAISKPTHEQIHNAVDFIVSLLPLRDIAASNSNIALASESCLSIYQIVMQTQARLVKLQSVEDSHLQDYLNNELVPALVELENWAIVEAERAGISYYEEIPYSGRILSPSDFGFHNALDTDQHKTIFLDFEYFGWDDPTKLVADFIVHPGMNLSDTSAQNFRLKISELFSVNPIFEPKLSIVIPLHALKWCTILLNKYLPNNVLVPIDLLARQRALQLGKARDMLTTCFNYQRGYSK